MTLNGFGVRLLRQYHVRELLRHAGIRTTRHRAPAPRSDLLCRAGQPRHSGRAADGFNHSARPGGEAYQLGVRRAIGPFQIAPIAAEPIVGRARIRGRLIETAVCIVSEILAGRERKAQGAPSIRGNQMNLGGPASAGFADGPLAIVGKSEGITVTLALPVTEPLLAMIVAEPPEFGA